jgi:hypothetical protein
MPDSDCGAWMAHRRFQAPRLEALKVEDEAGWELEVLNPNS